MRKPTNALRPAQFDQHTSTNAIRPTQFDQRNSIGATQRRMEVPRAAVIFGRMGFKHLRVHGAATQLRAEVDGLIDTLSPQARSKGANIVKHLDEAIDSVLNNIAEGNDSIYPDKKKNYLDIAGGSCREARNALQSLVRRELVPHARASKAIGLTYVIPKMLHAMAQKS